MAVGSIGFGIGALIHHGIGGTGNGGGVMGWMVALIALGVVLVARKLLPQD